MVGAGEIRLDDLAVDYDPIVDVGSGRLAGADIVAPLVELTELPTTAWRLVLLNALMTSVRWNQRGLVNRSFITSIALGPEQFSDPLVERAICAAVAGSGANPNALHLTITDEMLLHADEDAITRLIDLTNLGVKLAVVGPHACTHTARHRDVLEVSLLRVSLPDDEQSLSPTLLERAAALELQLMATGVDDESSFVDARRHGVRYSTGDFHRSTHYFVEIDDVAVEPIRS